MNLDGRVICDFERDRLHREVLRIQGQSNTRSEYDRGGRLRSQMRRPKGHPTQLPAAVCCRSTDITRPASISMKKTVICSWLAWTARASINVCAITTTT